MTTSPVTRLQEAIDKLTALKTDSTPGEWFWNPPSKDKWPQGDEGLDATHGQWRACAYYCKFDESSVTSRGISGKPGHEHLETEPVLSGWGHDASGINGSDADRELIVTLHRTIDAQLAILNYALGRIDAHATVPQLRALDEVAGTLSGALALADAIRGTK